MTGVQTCALPICNSIYIDHGNGVISFYFHLSRLDVSLGRYCKNLLKNPILSPALKKSMERMGIFPIFTDSPVGLDIGGASPPEIALSVAAEISTIKYRKNKIRHMRER